jgi:hypothetical protein
MPVVENNIDSEMQTKLNELHLSPTYFQVKTELYNYDVPYATQYYPTDKEEDSYAIFYSKEELAATAEEFKSLYMFLREQNYLDIFSLQGAKREYRSQLRERNMASLEHVHFHFNYEDSFYQEFQAYIEKEETNILEIWYRSLVYEDDTFFSVFDFHKQNGHILGLSAPENSFLFHALKKAYPLDYKVQVEALNRKGGIPLPVFKDIFIFLKNEIKELLEENGIESNAENVITFHILSTSEFFTNVFGNSFQDTQLDGSNDGSSYIKAMKNGVNIDRVITFNEMDYAFDTVEDYLTVMKLKTQMPYDSWIDAIGYVMHSREAKAK